MCHVGDCPKCEANVIMKCHCNIVKKYIDCYIWVKADKEEKKEIKSCGGECPKPVSDINLVLIFIATNFSQFSFSAFYDYNISTL